MSSQGTTTYLFPLGPCMDRNAAERELLTKDVLLQDRPNDLQANALQLLGDLQKHITN